MPTGVDRVELAYLRHLLQEPQPLFGLVRSTLGYVLLDARGMRLLSTRLAGDQPWGAADRLSWFARKKGPHVQRAESDLRRFALARCTPQRLGRMLTRHLPVGTAYFNIGHSNLTDRTLWAIRHDLKARIFVMIHDTIPLDYPQYQRPGTPERFRAKLRRVRGFADLVIYNSAHTRDQARLHMSAWGDVPDGLVAPLGVDLVAPDPSALPVDLDLSRPYFVTVGTIEPRKNHALLLDVWEDLIAQIGTDETPGLMICGARGWNNETVFARLDALPSTGPVHELSGLSDAAIAALLQGARALVFPSKAEGYGLPPIEAAALGTPVICLDLPVYRETLGDIPVYLKETDRYLLMEEVQSLSEGPITEQKNEPYGGFQPPTWDKHFRVVLAST